MCNNTYALWQAGMQNLPSHLEFAPMTSYQVAAAKDWAAKEVVAREADMQPVEAPEEPVQPPAPPLVHVEAMPGHNAAVGTTVWSPEVVAQRERIKAAAARASPNNVMMP